MTEITAPSSTSTTPRPEVHPMLFTECPLCDAPAPLDEASGALDCAACALRLELAPDESRVELPLAA